MTSTTHTIPELDRKGLREFGLVTGAIVAGLFGLFFPWLLEAKIPIWPWAVAVVLAAWGLIAPDSLRPLYRIWMRFGLLLGRITTPIILGAVFYVVMLPMALVMKILRHDPMSRAFDEKADTYRVSSRQPPSKNMERPF